MIAYYSSLAMVTSAVLYLVAMTAHAAEWASVRTAKVARPVPAMVGAPAEAPGPEVAVAVDGRRTELLGRIGLAVTVVAALTHVAGVVLRGVAAQRPPWGNMYEFVTTSLAIVAIVYLVLALRSGMRWLGLPVTLLLTIGQGLAVTVFYVDVSELMPALHSVWFVIHIIAAATAGAAFNVGGHVNNAHLMPGLGCGSAHFGAGALCIAKAIEHHMGALACQSLGDSQADAAGGTGNEGRLAFEHESISE